MSHAPPTRLLNEPHWIHQLVRGSLHKEQGLLTAAILQGDDIDLGWIRRGLASAGAGLDHTVGEQTLAFSLTRPEGFESFLLVSDRRICTLVDAAAGKLANARFDEIASFRHQPGLLNYVFTVQAGAEQHDVAIIDCVDQLQNFLRLLLEQPKGSREPAPRPLCVPTSDDPTGATEALTRLTIDDTRSEVLLTYVREAARAGMMPVPAAQDLVARIVLAHRNVHFGRGQHAGRFMSPLEADDLSHAMVTLFGPPVSHVEQPVRTLGFRAQLRPPVPVGFVIVRRPKSKLDKALDNVGSALDAVDTATDLFDPGAVAENLLGRALGPSAVSNFVFMVANTGSFASYRLTLPGSNVGLFRRAAPLADRLQAALLIVEDVLLVRRCVYGWQHPATALLETPAEPVLERLSAVLGPIDPARMIRRIRQ